MNGKIVVTVFCVISELLKPCLASCSRRATKEVICRSVEYLSGIYINENIQNLEEIKSVYVTNNGSYLDLSTSTFVGMVNLEKVDIHQSNLTKLFGDTFKDLPLTRIDISENELSSISPTTFNNLSKIRTIRLARNKLTIISKNIFSDMPLAVLTLSHNLIFKIEDGALQNLHNLKKLHLDDNRFSSIYPHRFLSDPEVLEILWLHNNSIRIVTANMLQSLKNLKLLNLAWNGIDIIEENAFEQCPSLDTLVLSKNHLKQLDGKVFPKTGMTNLERLYIDNNKLMFLSSNFFFKLLSLRKITLVGNPWYCDCLDAINRLLVENSIVEKCNEKFLTGSRPLCVADKARGYSCQYQYDDDLANTYLTYQDNNPLYVRTIDCIL